ncbi:MAG TPA: hypothetical protein DDX98_01155 [Bacteroidales bacterium]|jgi:type IX secretion system PorP/SprF family membrane protein|nr:hypothetical protein [Bacteroidales bacterium]
MRRWIVHIVIVFVPLLANAQLHSLSNQYVLNGMAINPAYAGTEEAFSATITYRNQWTGFEGAPKTITASLHTPLRNELIGLGLLVVNDQIGVNSETSILANYAYMIEVGDAKLSFGIGMGISFLDAGWDKLKSVDVQDLELTQEKISATNPNFSAGFYYYTDDFFLGLSAPFLFSYSYSGEDKDQLELKNDLSQYNVYLTSGYRFEMNNNFEFFPSALLKFNPGEAFQAELSGQFIYNEFLWAGLTYRSVDAFAFLLQLQATNQLRIAYSYDMGLKKTSRYYGGSHEVMLKYLFNFNARVVGPRRF